MRLRLDRKKTWTRHTFEVATRTAVIKENTLSRPKIPCRDKKTSRPAVLSHDLLEGSRQLNDAVTKKRSRHRIEVAKQKCCKGRESEVATSN